LWGDDNRRASVPSRQPNTCVDRLFARLFARLNFLSDGRLFKLGNQPISSKLEAYYNVERPDGAPDWSIQFTWQFLFPK